ncbi:MAG: hypothetical protein GXO87_08370, partial [Chlorobi bacterium]|nr:hypothetical protein [Chlorobiota bacterium]
MKRLLIFYLNVRLITALTFTIALALVSVSFGQRTVDIKNLRSKYAIESNRENELKEFEK